MKKIIFSICASLSLCASSSECFCLISLAVDEPIIEAIHIHKYTANILRIDNTYICSICLFEPGIYTCTQEKKAVEME